MIFSQIISRLVELGANQFIALDSESKSRLADIQGSIIQVKIQGFQLDFFLLIHADEIEVMSDFEGQSDTIISGTPGDLLALGGRTAELFSKNVQLSGNIEIAKKFSHYIHSVDIDWEEHLSKLVGDGVAFQVGSLARKLSSYVDNTGQSIRDDVAEYLVEETRSVVGANDIERFIADVDSLRDLSDRLEKRLSILESSKEKHP